MTFDKAFLSLQVADEMLKSSFEVFPKRSEELAKHFEQLGLVPHIFQGVKKGSTQARKSLEELKRTGLLENAQGSNVKVKDIRPD